MNTMFCLAIAIIFVNTIIVAIRMVGIAIILFPWYDCLLLLLF